VVGLGINNQPLIPALQAEGFDIIVADRKPFGELEALLKGMPLSSAPRIFSGPQYLDDLAACQNVEKVYLTPGMVKNVAPVEIMRSRGVAITCATHLFLQHCPAPVLGITGSAGKTTTTTLLGKAFEEDGRHPVFVGGNIGRSLLPQLSEVTPDSWVVMELSSFQLELVQHSPHGAAILNLFPNHLDIHGTMEAYTEAKSHIFRFQSREDWLLVPADNAIIADLLRGYRGQPIYFSRQDHGGCGTFVKGEWIMFRNLDGEVLSSMPLASLTLPGEHNLLNVMAAVAMFNMAGGDNAAMRSAAAEFHGVAHRLEKVGEYDNILYINDSIATAPERTMAALKAVRAPIVLIAGGYDKHLDYEGLGEAIAGSTVHHVVALGQTQEKIARAVAHYSTIPVIHSATFADAVQAAQSAAQPGDVVLLSPASASYDMFKNFEERGERFREIVRSL
jgi:UDP-N-acetylmuramoylalanine--D-glutamate ligase